MENVLISITLLFSGTLLLYMSMLMVVNIFPGIQLISLHLLHDLGVIYFWDKDELSYSG